jgi:NitT/TauT family transport system ATP-binding protein
MIDAATSLERESHAQAVGNFAISLKDVSKTYAGSAGDLLAVDNVSFDISGREFVSILGPSGCGKSTILRIIGGLQSYDGEVSVGGKRVVNPPEGVAIVFQKSNLLPWLNVESNLGLGAEIRGVDRAEVHRRVTEMVPILGLQQFEKSYPHQLSGGMQQRVNLGQALIQNPATMLLDEPFGALDALTRDRLNIELLRIWEEQRQTVFLVTHSINEAVFLSDRVLVMSSRPGRIIEDMRIELPRPRSVRQTRVDPRFAEYVTHLSEVMGLV